MLSAQRIYGAEAPSQLSSQNISLGLRLTRLLPEDAFDHQPLTGAGGRLVLIADVRLDNRDELAAALGIPLERAASLCDAAILLAALEQWDISCLERIVGDYAFVLWNGADQRLLLVRDPLGQRPLHYHRRKGFLAAASMPKGLHALPEVPVAPNEDRVAEFLVLMPDAGPQSYFAGVERVEPGHVVTVTPSEFTSRRYWQPRCQSLQLKRSGDYVEAMRERLDEAVRARLRGLTHVGVAMSGGLDSSGVAATAARLLGASGGRITAFTAVPREGFDGGDRPGRISDEGPVAAATVGMYPNMDHVLVRSTHRSLLDSLDRGFNLNERPVLNVCNAGWVYAINEAAQSHDLTVLLSGDMGNVGLSYEGWPLLPELFRKGHWLQWWRAAQALVARKNLRWRYLLVETLAPWMPVPLWTSIAKFRRGLDFSVAGYSAINPVRLAELDLPARARDRDTDLGFRPAKDSFSDRAWALSSVDPGNYAKGALGGWRVDIRDPTADLRLLEFCFSVPTEQFLSDGTPRALALLALADRLPKNVLEETRGGLQAADWYEQLTAARGEIAQELDRLAACAPSARALDLPRLTRLVENWPQSGWALSAVNATYRMVLLRALSAGHFLQRATTSCAGPGPGASLDSARPGPAPG